MPHPVPLLDREPHVFLEDVLPDLITASDSHTLRGGMLAADYIGNCYPAYPRSSEMREIVQTAHNVYDATNDLTLGELGLPDDKSSIKDRLGTAITRVAFKTIVEIGFGRPIINRNRAVGLFSLAVHKVDTREDHTVEAMTEDFRRPFKVSEVYNRRDVRLGWFDPYCQKLAAKGRLSINEGLSLGVANQVAQEYTLTRGKLLKSIRGRRGR